MHKSTTEEIIDAIAAHLPEAQSMLAEIQELCIYDSNFRSLLDIAIESNNRPIVDKLAESETVREFCPPLADELRQRIRTISSTESPQSADRIEQFLQTSIHEPIHWMRPPLLKACRESNVYALTALISQGAKLTVKDALGWDASVLCYMTGGEELLTQLFEICEAANHAAPVSTELLELIIKNPSLYQRAVSAGKLDLGARRLVFSVACASLDLDLVQNMIESGHNPEASHGGSTPIVEAATSRILYLHQHPDHTILANALTHAYGPGRDLLQTGVAEKGTSLLSELEAMSESEMEEYLFGEAQQDGIYEREVDSRATMPDQALENPKFHTQAQVNKRLAMIETLTTDGFDAKSLKETELATLLDDLVCHNEPQILAKLVEIGIDFAQLEDASDAVAWAIQLACYDIAVELEAMGLRRPPVLDHWHSANQRYEIWLRDAQPKKR